MIQATEENGPAEALLGLWSERVLMRTFRADPISVPILETLEYSACLGPRNGNTAQQHIVFVADDKELKPLQGALSGGLNKVNFWVRTAPVIAVALTKRTLLSSFRSIDPDRFDLIQALERVALIGQIQGIGSCPVLGFDGPAVQKAVGAPRQWQPVAVMALGHPGLSGQEIMGIAVIRDFNEYHHRLRERLDRRKMKSSTKMVSRDRFRGGIRR